MKFKNVYDLVRKLGGGEKMIKKIKKFVRDNVNDDIYEYEVNRSKDEVYRFSREKYNN